MARGRRSRMMDGTDKILGVNLGNWLVLEKWMGSSPLSTAASPDDHGLIDEFDPQELDEALRTHYESYVTADTFAWMAQNGVNLVRIPVPYHLFGTAHHRPCVAYLDRAMDWAAEQDMGVLIDLHTVPMGQNAFDNGGYLGMCAWHKDPARIDFVLGVLEQIARRYAGHPALWGLQPLNEPASPEVLKRTLDGARKRYPERVAASEAIPKAVLGDFYQRFFAMVRPILGPDVALVFHDRFRLGEWNRFMVGDGYENVWVDTHQYLCFADGDFERYDLEEYLRKVRLVAHEVRRAARYHPVLVGEWCLGNHASAPRELNEAGACAWYRVFADAQLGVWDEVGGSCFWSLRVDSPDHADWSFEQCVERGWIELR